MKEGSVFSSTSNQVLNTEGGVRSLNSHSNNNSGLKEIKMEIAHPQNVELINGDNNKSHTGNSILRDSLPNDLPHFFLEKHITGCNHLEVLDCMTGTGKTEQVVQYIHNNRGDDSFKVVYCASTVQELLEVVLRLRRKMASSGQRSDNINRFFQSSSRLSFNFDGSKASDLSKIKELMSSTEWSNVEKTFIKNLKCTTTKYETDSKLVFTTHKNLTMRSHLFSDYTVFIDEMPAFAYDVTRTRKNAAILTSWHCENVGLAGEKYIDPDMISYAVASGLVKIEDFGEGAVLYHINSNHPFKRCIVMTAYASSTGLGVLKRMGKDIEIVTTLESTVKYNQACDKIDLTICKNSKVSNKDTKRLEAELLKEAHNPSKAFTVSTASQEMASITVSSIRTNKVGINSLSDLNECLVATQLNLNGFEKAKYIEVFGEEEALDIERGLAGSKILQSVFRGCIRKGGNMRIVACSSECVIRIANVLVKYSK